MCNCNGGGFVPPTALTPAFYAHKTANQLNITGAVIVWESIDFIDSSAFSWNAATNALTILRPGIYHSVFVLQLEAVATNITLRHRRSGANIGDWSDTGAVPSAGLALAIRETVGGGAYDCVFASSAIRDILAAGDLCTWGLWKIRDL